MEISGAELRELKKLTFAMAESFGLDHRIEAYEGKHLLQLYRWNLDCLEAVLEDAVRKAEASPGRSPAPAIALKRLRERVHALREKAYQELK
jgi:hypothetical protein